MSLMLSLAMLAFAAPNAAPQDASAGKSDKLICKSTGATGSRVRAAKVCRTRDEWKKLEEASRKRLTDFRQNERSTMRSGPM